jgi:glycosyltransferase involved in cell wall biosynthesis
MKALIVIPAFNESKTIAKVINGLPKNIKNIFFDYLVVDDGSTDGTSSSVPKKSNTKVLRHLINRGAGAATRTGIDYGKSAGYDALITFDADGQHSAGDLEKLVSPLLTQNADLVIGSRLKKRQKMPTDRLLINWIANITTFLFFGVLSTDSQSGLKAFSKKAIDVIEIKSDRMEFSSEILLEAKKHNLKIVEVPTSAIYTKYSRQKGQRNLNGLPILARFIIKLLR